MRVTTKGHFAVTAMVDLALHEAGGPVTLAEISRRQHISLSYLEQLFGKLKRSDLVESTRGPGGGYSLGRGAESITVADVIVAVDGPTDLTCPGNQEPCSRQGTGCTAHQLWTDLDAHLQQFLESKTLQSLADQEIADGVEIEDAPPVRRAIASTSPVRPIHVNAPNSVFALGDLVSE